MTPKPTTIEKAASVVSRHEEDCDIPCSECAGKPCFEYPGQQSKVRALVTSWEAEPPPVMVEALMAHLLITKADALYTLRLACRAVLEEGETPRKPKTACEKCPSEPSARCLNCTEITG
jgi:hypothetical protein